MRLSIATTISYWIAVLYNFSLNRWWTFSANENRNLHKHLFAYGILLASNYVFTVVFLELTANSIGYAIAKPVSIPIQMIWNYYVYKNLIFKKVKADDNQNDRQIAP